MSLPKLDAKKKARIRKACDSCNVKRTKCDGNQPCGHCSQVRVHCTYLRKEKKRGRASDKYPKQAKSRKTRNEDTDLLQYLDSKRSQIPTVIHKMNDDSNRIGLISQTNVMLNYNSHKFELGRTAYPILQSISVELMEIGLPFDVADDLYEFFFDESYAPASKVFTALRRHTMLRNERPTQKNLLLVILLSAAVQADSKFFAGSIRDYVTARMYHLIQEKLPKNKYEFTLDDLIVIIHLGFLMPWLSYAKDSVYWWELGYDVAIYLGLDHNNSSEDEATKEEKRRAWWGLYILDRITALAFNRDIIIQDYECLDIYLPCDESLWMSFDDELISAETDVARVKSVHYDIISDGVYGWYLALAKIMGMFVQYKNLCMTDASEAIKLQCKQHLLEATKQTTTTVERKQIEVNTISCPIKEKSYKCDLFYAKFISLIIRFTVRNTQNWECLIQFDYIVSEDKISQLSECIAILEEIMKLDEDMHRYPFLVSFFLFLSGVSVLSMLNSVNNDDYANINKINRFKYYVKILVRVMEAVMVILPSEFLKMVRTHLIWSVKDWENLVLLTDYVDKFKENALKRKHAISAYSWGAEGRGLAI